MPRRHSKAKSRLAPALRSRHHRLAVESLETRWLLTVETMPDVFDVRQGDGFVELDVLANDVVAPDYTGDVAITSVTNGNEGGQIQIQDGARLAYLAPLGFHGEETFRYTIDGQFTGQVVVNVESPVRDDEFQLNPGTATQTLDVLANDPFWEDFATEGVITAVGRSSVGASVEISADGLSLNYIPTPNTPSVDFIDYVVDDQYVATVSVSILHPLWLDRVDLLMGQSIQFDVIENDPFFPEYEGERKVTDLLDVPETIIASLADDGRSVELETIPGLEYRFNEAHIPIRYVVDNAFEDFLVVSVINPTQGDSFTVDANSTAVELDPLSNDGRDHPIEVEVERITGVDAVSTNGGTVTTSTDGQTVFYTPARNFVGIDTFRYIVDETYPATVRVWVAPPMIRDDRYGAELGDVGRLLPVLENDSLGGPGLITDLDTSESRGTFIISEDQQSLLYTAPTDIEGTRANAFPGVGVFLPSDAVTYEVDGVAQATVEVELALPRPFYSQRLFQDDLGTPFTVSSDDLTTNLSEYYPDSRIVTSVTQPDNDGSVSISPSGDGVTVTPGIGTTSFEYTIDNRFTGTARLFYDSSNRSTNTTVDQNSLSEITIRVHDPGNYLNVSPGASVTAVDERTVLYQPPPDFVGQDSFEFVTNGYLTETVNVNVIRHVVDDVFRVDVDSENNELPVMLNDLIGTDYEGDALITSVTAEDPDALVSIGSDGKTLFYTPSGNGDRDTLVYRVDEKLRAEVTVHMNESASELLTQFDSSNALQDYLIEAVVDRRYVQGIEQCFNLACPGPGEFTRGSVPFSGPDEPNVVENDGAFLYTVSGNELAIANTNSGELELVSRTELQGDPVGFYLSGNRLAVITTLGEFFTKQHTLLAVYDIADRANPAVVHVTSFDGAYVGSRHSGDTVSVITTPKEFTTPEPHYTIQDYSIRLEPRDEFAARTRDSFDQLLSEQLPTYASFDGDGNLLRQGLLVAPEDIFVPTNAAATQLMTISSLDIGSDHGTLLATKGVLTETNDHAFTTQDTRQVFASLDNLYVFSSVQPLEFIGQRLTNISQLSWDAHTGEIDFVSSADIPGLVRSVDEHNGDLRIFTSAGSLFVLRNDTGVLEPVGSLQNIAPDIFPSVQFDGDRAIVVNAARNIDSSGAAIGIDLSNHSDPRVDGSLSLPFFGTYQQFIDSDHVLAVGENARRGDAPLVSLISFGDFANPMVVGQVELPLGTSAPTPDSQVLEWFATQNVLTLPSQREDTLYVYQIDANEEETITLLGTAVHVGGIQGTTIVGDILHTVANDSIQSSPIDNPSEQIARVEWEPTQGEEPAWIPLAPESEEVRAMVAAAISDLSARLDVRESEIILVTNEESSVVLRSGEQQYLYEVDDNGETGLVASDFEFAEYQPQHNSADPLDVNNDGHITPVDAVIIVNHLNNPVTNGVRSIDTVNDPWFQDVNNDGEVAPLDALQVVNRLNLRARTQIVTGTLTENFTDCSSHIVLNADGTVGPSGEPISCDGGSYVVVDDARIRTSSGFVPPDLFFDKHEPGLTPGTEVNVRAIDDGFGLSLNCDICAIDTVFAEIEDEDEE